MLLTRVVPLGRAPMLLVAIRYRHAADNLSNPTFFVFFLFSQFFSRIQLGLKRQLTCRPRCCWARALATFWMEVSSSESEMVMTETAGEGVSWMVMVGWRLLLG